MQARAVEPCVRFCVSGWLVSIGVSLDVLSMYAAVVGLVWRQFMMMHPSMIVAPRIVVVLGSQR